MASEAPFYSVPCILLQLQLLSLSPEPVQRPHALQAPPDGAKNSVPLDFTGALLSLPWNHLDNFYSAWKL